MSGDARGVAKAFEAGDYDDEENLGERVFPNVSRFSFFLAFEKFSFSFVIFLFFRSLSLCLRFRYRFVRYKNQFAVGQGWEGAPALVWPQPLLIFL